MKKLAVDYMHPEVGVRTSDPTAYGRNFYNRPSAPMPGITKGESVEVSPEQVNNVSVPKSTSKIVGKGHSMQSDAECDIKRSPSSVMLFGVDELSSPPTLAS